MRFIENERMSARQNFAEALLFDREIGEQQVMIDHDEIGFLRGAACLDYEAVVKLRTFRAETVLRSRGHARPQRRIFRYLGKLAAIATARTLRPGSNRMQMRGLLTRSQAPVLRRLLRAMQAQIICAPLEQAGFQSRTDGLAHAWQITMEQLVLQRLRAGRYDHAL